MQKVMEFLRVYWLSVASGAVTLAMLGVFAIGFMSTAVADKLTQRAGFANQLNIEPKNQNCIDVQRANAQRFVDEYEKVLQVAETQNRYKPLMDGVFPVSTSTSAAFEFKDAYAKAIVELMGELGAGDIPNDEDRAEAREEIEEIKTRYKKDAAESGGKDMPKLDEQNDPMLSVEKRAAIKRARSIRMYASLHESRQSLHVSPIINSETAPPDGLMWFAQVGLWIQQDIIDAIKTVNDRALSAGNGDTSVESSPIKRLEGIKINGYWTPSLTFVEFPILGNPGVIAPITSFTKRTCDDKFDVIRVSMLMIVDQREILNVLDAFCTNRFFQVVHLEYVSLPPNADNNVGYYYGSSPVVRMQLQLEVYTSRKALLPLMPELIQKAVGAKK